MPRTFAARDRVLQVASQRLSALVGARQEVSTPEQQPIVIDAPENALRPIAQAAAVICLLLESWCGSIGRKPSRRLMFSPLG